MLMWQIKMMRDYDKQFNNGAENKLSQGQLVSLCKAYYYYAILNPPDREQYAKKLQECNAHITDAAILNDLNIMYQKLIV